jgi:hypothetical protein
LSNLAVGGTGAGSANPDNTSIIKASETFSMSVQVDFAPAGNVFLDLLLGVPLTVETSFQVEGFGTSTEANLAGIPANTTSGNYTYTPTFTGTATGAGLSPGVYQVAVVVTIKWGATPIAFGFVSDKFFQIYP